jgi:hypothetical protein
MLVAVLFDLSGSYAKDLGATELYYVIQFDDIRSDGSANWAFLTPTNRTATGIWSERLTVVPHVYLLPGTKHVNVTVSDRPFQIPTDSNQLPYSVTSDGLPAPVIYTRFIVTAPSGT